MRRLISATIAAVSVVCGLSNTAHAVEVSEVTWEGDRPCFKIQNEFGQFYWESPENRSGFVSFVDINGVDWIQSDFGDPAVDYRGFPNSIGDWGHPSRNNGTAYNTIVGDSSGEHIIIESEKPGAIKARIHAFESHLAIEVLEVNGEHNFLFEGLVGGEIAAHHYVLPDGTEKEPGEWLRSPNEETQRDIVIDWPEDDGGEWFYVVPDNSEIRMWMAHTPADDIEGECNVRTTHMDLYSFGRTFEDTWTPLATGAEHKVMWGFINDPAMTHDQIAEMIRGIMANPLANWTKQDPIDELPEPEDMPLDGQAGASATPSEPTSDMMAPAPAPSMTSAPPADTTVSTTQTEPVATTAPGTPAPTAATTGGDAGGCAVGESRNLGWPSAWYLLGLSGLLRRRRRR